MRRSTLVYDTGHLRTTVCKAPSFVLLFFTPIKQVQIKVHDYLTKM